MSYFGIDARETVSACPGSGRGLSQCHQTSRSPGQLRGPCGGWLAHMLGAANFHRLHGWHSCPKGRLFLPRPLVLWSRFLLHWQRANWITQGSRPSSQQRFPHMRAGDFLSGLAWSQTASNTLPALLRHELQPSPRMLQWGVS